MQNSQIPSPQSKTESLRKWIISGVSLLILTLVLLCIINNEAISKWVGRALSICSPIFIGVLIAYLCNPLLNVLERLVFNRIAARGLRRAISLVFTYLVVLLMLTAVLALIIPQIRASYNELVSDIDVKILEILKQIESWLSNLSFFNLENTDLSEYINKEKIFDLAKNLLNITDDIFETVTRYITGYGSAIISTLYNILLGLFFSVYLLIFKERIFTFGHKAVTALCSEKSRAKVELFAKTLNDSFGGFFKGKVIDSLIIGILAFVVFLILDIPFAILIAFIVGMTNIIPVVGPFIGAIPSAFIIFISEPSKTIPFLITIFLIQQIDGNIIGPRILGDNTGLNPIGVLLAIIIMGGYFGIVGMLLGVPLFATVWSLITIVVDERLSAKNQQNLAMAAGGAGGPADRTEDPAERGEGPSPASAAQADTLSDAAEGGASRDALDNSSDPKQP